MRKPLIASLALAGAVACSADGPFAALRTFDFDLVAPEQIPNKRVVTIEARITRLGRAQYPLTVAFEKANVGEDFYGSGEVTLRSPGERVAQMRIPILADPMIRVTVRESSDAGLSVSKTVRIDVLNFP